VFRSVRALVASYIDEYVDATGSIEGYGVFDLRSVPNIDWRFSKRNLWALERALTQLKHRPIRISHRRISCMRARYLAYREAHGGKKPLFYRSRRHWTEVPREFL
jgi:hypothetical protein